MCFRITGCSLQTVPDPYFCKLLKALKMLFVIKPDIFCIPCKMRVCKFPKNSMDVNYRHPETKDQGTKVLLDYYISQTFGRLRLPVNPYFSEIQGSYMPSYRQWSENCNNVRGLLVLDPEPKDMYRCHPYRFTEICKPPVNKPIRSYQIHHLKLLTMKHLPTKP